MRCLLINTLEQVNLFHIKTLLFHQLKGEIEVVGYFHLRGENFPSQELLGIPVLREEELTAAKPDVVVVVCEDGLFVPMQKMLAQALLPAEKIIPFSQLFYPEFSFPKYLELKNNVPTIFVDNCWGGFTYHRLGLEFQSPFINMYTSEEDFVKFSFTPEQYLKEELRFLKYETATTKSGQSPVAVCGDLELHFNHMDTYEEAVLDWEKRKKRVKWGNSIFVLSTENRSLAERFIQIPREKKMVFSPYDLSSEHSCRICKEDYTQEEVDYKELLLGFSSRVFLYYDVVELLLHGRIVEARCI